MFTIRLPPASDGSMTDMTGTVMLDLTTMLSNVVVIFGTSNPIVFSVAPYLTSPEYATFAL